MQYQDVIRLGIAEVLVGGACGMEIQLDPVALAREERLV
jgi:hypothetical protein